MRVKFTNLTLSPGNNTASKPAEKQDTNPEMAHNLRITELGFRTNVLINLGKFVVYT